MIWSLPLKAKFLWHCAARTLLWHIWLKKNRCNFEDKFSSFEIFFFFVGVYNAPPPGDVLIIGNSFVTTAVPCL